MKLVCLCLTLILLSSCGKKSSNSCSSTKDTFSTWTSRETGNIFAMQGCSYDNLCEVKFGSGACNNGRGDFNILISENGRAVMSNCADTTVIDSASYSICKNILSITYDSDDSIELFD